MRSVLLAFTLGLVAQAQPAFEVATVKRSPPPEGDRININLGNVRNGALTFANASLSDCLKFAYGLVSDAQLSGPDWTKSKEVRFDIVAQVPPDTPRERLLAMLQSLLAERLNVAVHHQSRELSYLALRVGKEGPKLREVPRIAREARGLSMAGHIAGSRMSMQTVALLISRFERQTVLDETGLKGLYEIKLEWTPDFPPLVNGAPAETAPGPSLFAVQEQLGLKLESRKGPVDVLVVDHADQIPAEN
ncbi:MAG TPA: TIGR03435 family protein [Bryobacteraceae bacterium]